MSAVARRGDLIVGGAHCHGHPHGPLPSPGRIREGSSRVFAEGLPVARAGDRGHSPVCCGGIGDILIQVRHTKVFVDGLPVAVVGSPTLHCGMAPGVVQTGSRKVSVL
jgi:uncharacterized Zn-binding protein involved in type VI secretion